MGEASGCQAGNSSFLHGTLLIGDDSLLPPFPPGTVFTCLTQEAFKGCSADGVLSFMYELPASRNAAQEP